MASCVVATAPSAMMGTPVSRAGGVGTRPSSTPAVQPRRHARSAGVPLLRVPTATTLVEKKHARTTVVARASPDDDTPPPPGASSSRRDIINGVFFAISVPLWRDIAHDLGYLHGTGSTRTCVLSLRFFSVPSPFAPHPAPRAPVNNIAITLSLSLSLRKTRVTRQFLPVYVSTPLSFQLRVNNSSPIKTTDSSYEVV